MVARCDLCGATGEGSPAPNGWFRVQRFGTRIAGDWFSVQPIQEVVELTFCSRSCLAYYAELERAGDSLPP